MNGRDNIPAPDAELDDALAAGIHKLTRVRGHVRVTAVLRGVNTAEVKLRADNLAWNMSAEKLISSH